jgi:hypothetical protein
MKKDEIKRFEKMPLADNDLKKIDLMSISGITRIEINIDDIKVETCNGDILKFNHPSWFYQKKIIKNLVEIIDESLENEDKK